MTILQNCILHAKQSEITHTEMYLKQSYIPTIGWEVCCYSNRGVWWEHVTVV